MSRKTRKLIWPLPGMATFAIVAALAILVALPVGIALAQQETETTPGVDDLKAEAAVDAPAKYTTIMLSWTKPDEPEDDPASTSNNESRRIDNYRIDVSEDGKAWH